MRWIGLARVLGVSLLAGLCVSAAVAADVQQFSLIGPLQRFTLNSGTSLLRGARIRVNGIDVVVPDNLLVEMPTKFLSPAQLVAMNPAGGGQTGLAIEDAVKPLAAFETTVTGNIVDGVYIAGLVAIAQNSLNTGSGVVTSIAADGTMIVGTGGTRVKLNDPTGRFGRPSIGQDSRFSVDDANASVIAATGFPMCIPRSGADARCPAVNRPVDGGRPRTLFVMGMPVASGLAASPADGLSIPGCPACQPGQQAPIRTGDMITYEGILARDAAGVFVSAYGVTDNVGIYTRPGANPAYLMIEGALVGTVGPATPRPASGGNILPQETQDRFRIEGTTTDPSRAVIIYAVDVNPGTGEKRLRELARAVPQDAPLGRYRFIVNKNAGILFKGTTVKGATRELAVRIDTGTDANNGVLEEPQAGGPANGLVTGQYVAPVDEYIFPENKLFGDPLVPANFECLAFLQLGSGPLTPGGPKVGRLAPWPGGQDATHSLTCGP